MANLTDDQIDEQPPLYRVHIERSYDQRAKAIIAFNTRSGDLDDKLDAAWRATIGAPAIAAQPEGWKLVPIEPTVEMISAMACSKARDDEGEFPLLLDLIDFSGENKTHTVLKAAYRAMLAAAPASAPTVQAGLLQDEPGKDARKLSKAIASKLDARELVRANTMPPDAQENPDLLSAVTLEIWNRFASEHRATFAEEPHKAEYHFAAEAVIALVRKDDSDYATPPAAQEAPVGFVHPSTLGLLESGTNCAMFKPGHETEGSIALYTRQAVKQEPLSAEEIERILDEAKVPEYSGCNDIDVQIVRAIERAHGINGEKP